MFKAAAACIGPLHSFVQGILPGMAKGGVAQVMGQGDGLDQIFIQPQGACDGAAELRHLQRMREPGAKQIALMVQKNLGFVNQATKSRAVDNAITVALVVIARRRVRFGKTPTTAALGVTGPEGQNGNRHE